MSKISITQAAQLTGKHRDTINNATNSGKLSFELNAEGNKVVDVSELQRVYPIVKTVEELEAETHSATPDTNSSDNAIKEELIRIRETLKHRNEVNETLSRERDRERAQLVEEIETLRAALKHAQDQQTKAMLLVTDQREGGGDRLAAIEARLEQQMEHFDSVLDQTREEVRRNTLQEVDNRSAWEKLFGKKLSA